MTCEKMEDQIKIFYFILLQKKDYNQCTCKIELILFI
jgi:hypothetical protein